MRGETDRTNREIFVMKISVVIPVYNEEKHITSCLEALQNNTRKADEILLADGGSEDRTRELAARFPEVTILDNPKRTAAAGRNVGIRRATGSVIAFTDGDCIVRENWLEEIEAAFRKYRPDGIGGKIEPADPENQYEEFWNTLAWKVLMSFGDEAYQVKNRTMNDAFVTANCAYTRKLLYRLKGFNLWFGNNAEDVDLSWRALEAGAKLWYVPSVEIQAHGVTTPEGIRNKSFRNGVSSSKIQKKYGSFVNYDVNIYKLLLQHLKGIVRDEADAGINLMEVTCHLLGKYYGSLKNGVINV